MEYLRIPTLLSRIPDETPPGLRSHDWGRGENATVWRGLSLTTTALELFGGSPSQNVVWSNLGYVLSENLDGRPYVVEYEFLKGQVCLTTGGDSHD